MKIRVKELRKIIREAWWGSGKDKSTEDLINHDDYQHRKDRAVDVRWDCSYKSLLGRISGNSGLWAKPPKPTELPNAVNYVLKTVASMPFIYAETADGKLFRWLDPSPKPRWVPAVEEV